MIASRVIIIIMSMGMLMCLIGFFTETDAQIQAFYIFISYPLFAFIIGYVSRFRQEGRRLISDLNPPLKVKSQ